MKKKDLSLNHRFLDEAGDSTFYGKGETRYYNYIKDQISLVMDIYDTTKYDGWKNYYNPRNPLTTENKISPLLH